jgi:hypothetical protein
MGFGEERVSERDLTVSPSGFAANVGIAFKTPEEFFLGAAAEQIVRHFDPASYIDDASSSPGMQHVTHLGFMCALSPTHLPVPSVQHPEAESNLICQVTSFLHLSPPLF